jgi:hypothetical protein
MTGIPLFLPNMGADRKDAQRRVKHGEHASAHITHRAGSSPTTRFPAVADATMCRAPFPRKVSRPAAKAISMLP